MTYQENALTVLLIEQMIKSEEIADVDMNVANIVCECLITALQISLPDCTKFRILKSARSKAIEHAISFVLTSPLTLHLRQDPNKQRLIKEGVVPFMVIDRSMMIEAFTQLNMF